MGQDMLRQQSLRLEKGASQVARDYVHAMRIAGRSTATTIPLLVKESIKPWLLQHAEFKYADTVGLFVMARAMIRNRLPVYSRECAIAILMSAAPGTPRMKVENGLPVGRKFRD